MALEREDIIDGLQEVVAELRTRGERAGIRIVGGAALSLHYFDRASTTMFIPPMRDSWQEIFNEDGIVISVGSPEMLLAMKLNASRPGRDESDIAQLLAICSIDSVSAAEDRFGAFYPGGVLQDKAYRLIDVVFRKGLPTHVDSPPVPRLG